MEGYSRIVRIQKKDFNSLQETRRSLNSTEKGTEEATELFESRILHMYIAASSGIQGQSRTER